MLFLTKGSSNIRCEEVWPLQHLAILTELHAAVGHKLRQIRRLNFRKDTIQIDSRFQGHAVDDVDQIA